MKRGISLSWAYIDAAPQLHHNGKQRIVIFASKLAGCAGMHKYMNQDEMRYEFQHALYGLEARDVIPEGYMPPKEYEEVAKAGLTTYAKTLLSETKNKITCLNDATLTSKIVTDTISMINTMEDVSEAAKELVRKELNTHHGTVGEDSIRADTQQAVEGRSISVDNKFRTCPRPLFEIDKFDIYVGGKHDGLMKDEDGHATLTEIKNRTRRHLGVPLYERVQLHAYMEIFGVRKGMLIENYRKNREEHDVYFDDDLWAGVMSSTEKFIRDSIITL